MLLFCPAWTFCFFNILIIAILYYAYVQENKTLVSPGTVCYAEKKRKTFLMVKFDTIKFFRNCRTILVTSGVSKKNTDEKP